MIASAFIMLYMTIAMLMIATTALPWTKSSINTQHIVNEVVFYTICACLVSSACIADYSHSIVIGWFLIILICLFIMYNVIAIVYDMLRYLKTLMVRYNRSLPRRLGNFVLSNRENCCFCLIKRKKRSSKQQEQKILSKITPQINEDAKRLSYLQPSFSSNELDSHGNDKVALIKEDSIDICPDKVDIHD